MPLEATIIVVDNSEHSRNGDYIPNRFDAQSDTVSMIFNAKTSANPESSVGLLSMGGAQPEILTTLTTDFGRVINGMARTKIKGESHFATALNVAGLALKHRQNKSQSQRIILFTCSPLPESVTDKDMIKLAKRLKKLAIAVDIVALGAALDSTVLQKLEAFHNNIKGPDDAEHQSHLATMPPGPELLSDRIRSTPILAAEGMGMGGGGGADGGDGGASGGGGFEYGVDPSADPELALALRMSMEEEEARAQRQVREAEEREGKTDLETVPEAPAEGEDAAGASSSKGDAKDGEKNGDDIDKKDGGEGSAGSEKMDTS